MIDIKDKNKNMCCGCTACASICPQKAIIMKEDFEGFKYPIVDKERCIDCGLCEKVCPVIHKIKEVEKSNCAYAIRCKDIENLKDSTSGGFFIPFAKHIINNDGIVYGVGYGNNFKVEHKRAEKIESIEEFKGSKYVQSDLNNIFIQVKKDLEENRIVLFSGTPCQIHGLKNYLQKEYSNLITVDLICHGTPSPRLWQYYVEYQEKKYKSKISKVNFRNKTYGYHCGTMKLEFKNSKRYFGSARIDYFLKSFFSEISSRPICYDCKFKDVNHISDFTIYDCWHFKELSKSSKDDDKGYTNLIINTSKGIEYFKNIQNEYEFYEIDKFLAIKCDGIMVENSAIPHKNRKNFYKDLEALGIQKCIEKNIPISKTDYVLEKIKVILYKTKLLKFIQLIKR